MERAFLIRLGMLLRTAVWLVFVVACWLSFYQNLDKLLQKRKSTNTRSETLKEYRFPSLSICALWPTFFMKVSFPQKEYVRENVSLDVVAASQIVYAEKDKLEWLEVAPWESKKYDVNPQDLWSNYTNDMGLFCQYFRGAKKMTPAEYNNWPTVVIVLRTSKSDMGKAWSIMVTASEADDYSAVSGFSEAYLSPRKAIFVPVGGTRGTRIPICLL